VYICIDILESQCPRRRRRRRRRRRSRRIYSYSPTL
jgi:hypothetical protein